MNQCSSWWDVDRLLNENYMPKDLYDMYSHIIFRLKNTLTKINFDKAIVLLRCCACSVRPLRLEEIVEVLRLHAVVAKDGTCLEGQNMILAQCKEYEDEVRKICGSLIYFRASQDQRPGSSTLHFIHLSAKEFLTTDSESVRSSKQATLFKPSSEEVINLPRAHANMFWDCVAYLSQECFQEPITEIRGNSFAATKLASHPFFVYAATTWPLHLRNSGNASIEETRARLQKFFEGANLRTWMEGAVALKDGLEWLHLIRLSIEKWLSQSPNARTAVPAFEDWGHDIAGPSFMVPHFLIFICSRLTQTKGLRSNIASQYK
jgi:hypothetical protein